MIRTYNLRHGINKVKQDKVRSVLKAYRRTCNVIARKQWRMFFEEGKLDKMADIKAISSVLSERYKRNCCYQVHSVLGSFISNRQNDFKRKVYQSSLGEETRKHLFQINKRKLWFTTSHELFSDDELFLARKIFKYILSKHRKPSFRHINMLLNRNVAQIMEVEKDKAVSFDYWIKFSTLEQNNPVMLPIYTNHYFDSIVGNLKQAVQFNINRNGELVVGLMKEIEPKPFDFKAEKISIDIGLKNLFSLDDGSFFGRTFYRQLKRYDAAITLLAANRQRQGFKTRSKRYDLLVRKLRGFIKNEIRRSLNRIVSHYAPKKIIIERLDFRNQNLSRRTNRLLSKFGKHEIITKLDALKEEYGIDYQEINAAYTSQECNKCGYVDKRNRPTQEKFKCKFCGYTRHADVVGARNHDVRSSDRKLANIYLNRKVILHRLVMRFVEQNPRHCSLANGLLRENPYFKGYLEQPKLAA